MTSLRAPPHAIFQLTESSGAADSVVAEREGEEVLAWWLAPCAGERGKVQYALKSVSTNDSDEEDEEDEEEEGEEGVGKLFCTSSMQPA